jgi:S-adenosylmethionine-dependent methyltransferase
MGELFQRIRLDLIDHVLAETVGASPQRVLDIGCGTGETALRFAVRGAQVLAVDPSDAMLRRVDREASQQGLTVKTLNAGLEQLSQLAAEFDLVICHNVLGFVAHPARATHTMANLVAPGGYLSLVVNNSKAEPLRYALVEGDMVTARRWIEQPPRSRPSNMFDHPLAHYSEDELEQWMTSAGLQDITLNGNTTVTSYLHERHGPPDYTSLLTLEAHLGRLSPYRDVSLFLHAIGRRPEVPK